MYGQKYQPSSRKHNITNIPNIKNKGQLTFPIIISCRYRLKVSGNNMR
ncbi:MAG: hypothetical protein ACI8WB_005868, partial [Phenylobacterium sp.]